MICRLCLMTLNEDNAILLFDASENETEMTKIIAKFLYLELTQNDEVSTTICQVCWRNLDNFRNFCEFVEEKQNNLHNKLEARCKVSGTDLPEELEESLIDNNDESMMDRKDEIIEGDIYAKHKSPGNEFAYASDDGEMLDNTTENYVIELTTRMQKFRQKLKENGDKYEAYLQKERERDKKRRGTQKLLSNEKYLTDKRRKDRERQQKFREKKKMEKILLLATTSKTRSFKLATNMQKYRQKLKENEEIYEAHLHKERERVKKIRETQKLLTNEKSLEDKRKKDRERQQRFREKKKMEDILGLATTKNTRPYKSKIS